MKQRCWTCKHIEKEDGERANANRVYRCGWTMPKMRLPDSITLSYRGHLLKDMDDWKAVMRHNDGATCPTWGQRVGGSP